MSTSSVQKPASGRNHTFRSPTAQQLSTYCSHGWNKLCAFLSSVTLRIKGDRPGLPHDASLPKEDLTASFDGLAPMLDALGIHVDDIELVLTTVPQPDSRHHLRFTLRNVDGWNRETGAAQALRVMVPIHESGVVEWPAYTSLLLREMLLFLGDWADERLPPEQETTPCLTALGLTLLPLKLTLDANDQPDKIVFRLCNGDRSIDLVEHYDACISGNTDCNLTQVFPMSHFALEAMAERRGIEIPVIGYGHYHWGRSAAVSR